MDTYCSDCKRNTEVVFDHAAGDTVCSECGLVLESRSIDETSEWRTFADESGDHDPNRVGGPVNPLLGDAGLSTVISKGPNGSNGDGSLARLQNRGGDPDRAIVIAFKTIANMADRGLNNILRLYVKKVNSSKWEQVPIPSSVRSIVTLNLPSYGSGRNPWGNLKPEYLEKRGFVEAHADDGYVEIFGLKHGWHASMVMVELISAKHIAQASAIRFELRGGEWKEAYMQMDGEPWKQPMSKEFSTFVEIKRVHFQSVMIHGE